MRTILVQTFAGVALIALSTTTQAQSVTKAQQDAVRANCRSDFMTNCSSVTPGGREALMCLEQNKAKLSAGCKSAIDTIAAASAPKPAAPAETKSQPATAPAAAMPVPAEKSAPAAKAPAPAKPAAKSAPAPKAAAAPAKPVPPALATAPTTPVATPPPTATPDTAPRRTTLGEAVIIRRFCGNDYRVLCKGTQIGGGRAIQCLANNRPALSPGCKAAMADTGN